MSASGDCYIYIVVGGLPQPRADHLKALARLTLVNVASRMESSGIANRIQVPHDVYERLRATSSSRNGERSRFLVAQKDVDC